MHHQKNAKSPHPPGSAARQQEKDLKQPSFILQRNGECPVHSLMEGSLMLENLTHGAVFNNLEALVATADPGVSCWEPRRDYGKSAGALFASFRHVRQDRRIRVAAANKERRSGFHFG